MIIENNTKNWRRIKMLYEKLIICVDHAEMKTD
jgi:hypothetical protein